MPMVITNPALPDNPIVFANEAFQNLTGYGRAEIVGRNCRFLQGAETDRSAVSQIREAIEQKRSIGIDLLNYRKDGSTFWNALYLSPVFNDAGETQFFFASLMDVTERVNAQNEIRSQKDRFEKEVHDRTAALETALEAKTLLLHEVDHRVKNNLTMIGSLLRLQARGIKDEGVRSTLESMLERVDALATVHRQLYQSDDVAQFDLGGLAASLVVDVLGASGRKDIIVDVTTDPLMISSKRASAFGLILNELFTNAVKHAYADGRPGKLYLQVTKEDDRGCILIEDDGPGFNPAKQSKGLGQTLISRLARQVGAEIRWQNALPGARVSIEFPIAEGGA
jgi:PAS domain S-box-containing protein